jgi:hypothetical protein
MPQGVPRLKPADLLKLEATKRDALLQEFDMMTEDQLAALFGVEIKTLKNRPPSELPPFTKTGGQRLFFKEGVRDYLRKRTYSE